MPELPEVECVRSVLEPYLVGRTVTQVKVDLRKVTANMTPEQFTKLICGQTIQQLTRRGKYLNLHFQSGVFAVVHLRMTGTLVLEDAQVTPQKHTNLALQLDNGQQLRFVDSRGFGKWWLFRPDEPDTSGQQKLGVEPHQVTAAYLQDKIGKRRTALKKLLLDQTIVAGIGNIYADEICFNAGILPTRWGSSLTAAEIKKLCTVIPQQIAFYTQKHHVSFAVYAASNGTSYQNSTYLQVYGRAKQPCTRCQKPLTGTTIGGRSSVFCTHCQK